MNRVGSDDVPPETREAVATAVRLALSKHGYAGLTTRKVAAESDMSEAGLFYYYDSKDDLVLAFVDWAIERFEAQLADVETDDPVAQLYALCEHLLGDYGDEVARDVNIAMMELLAHAPFNERFHARLEAYERRVVDRLAAVIEAGIEREVFRPVDAESTAAFLLVATNGTAGAVMALGMRDVDEGARARLFDYLDTTVLAPDVPSPRARN